MVNLKHKKVGILFSGGPAPSANAVISSVALNFLDNNIPVVGIMHGYSKMQDFDKYTPNLQKDVDYTEIDYAITQARNRTGVILKTSRANPGKEIHTLEDLKDSSKNKKLSNIIEALEYLEIGALVSIGGDDTLKTANFLWLMGFPVIHVPKTIDNDYYGIPWTFGYWTAVDTAQKLLLNLKADAQATDSFYIVELMGRKAGWVTYAAGVASEAILMVSGEDIKEEIINVDKLVESICDVINSRKKDKKPYGVIAIAEGLVDKLPEDKRPKEKDKHGNPVYSTVQISSILAERIRKCYKSKTGESIKVTPKQIGYETRSGPPIAFDVVMGSMLGYGVYTFYHDNCFGVMVSVTDNFDIKSVPFSDLIDPVTLHTRLRDVPRGSDFYKLKERLSYRHIFED